MNREQANRIKIGDMLRPIEKWNRTERVRKMAAQVKVLDIIKPQQSQTGVMLQVRLLTGETEWLDAAWFAAPGT